MRDINDAVGVTIGGYHTYKDWGLVLTSASLPNPTAKTTYVDIPGASGTIDLTEAAGGIAYNDRTISLTLFASDDVMHRCTRNGVIANAIHGKRLKIIMDTDLSHYYLGRVNFDSWEIDSKVGTLSFTITCDPWRYDLMDSSEPWMWSPFSFVDGVTTDGLTDISISGTESFNIVSSAGTVYPVIISTASIKAKIDDGSYITIAANDESKQWDLPITAGSHKLTLSGTATVTIKARGQSL